VRYANSLLPVAAALAALGVLLLDLSLLAGPQISTGARVVALADLAVVHWPLRSGSGCAGGVGDQLPEPRARESG
jgi:hypothetical protein